MLLSRTLGFSQVSPRIRRCGVQGRKPGLRVYASRAETEPHIQLATAKLPSKVSNPAFNKAMYQWASTLTQSGANYPFVLTLAVDKLEEGFKISLLKNLSKEELASAGDIEATTEDVPNQGTVLFVRFFEGPASSADRRVGEAPKDPQQRLDNVIDGLVDVQTLMQTMPTAIRRAIQMSST